MYREKDTFRHNYFQFLARCKMIHAKVPSTDPEEIKDYVNNLNKTMNFTGKDVIKVEDLDPNEIKKFHVKNFMNQVKLPIITFLNSLPNNVFLYRVRKIHAKVNL